MPAGLSPLAGKPYEANIDFEVRFMADSKVAIQSTTMCPKSFYRSWAAIGLSCPLEFGSKEGLQTTRVVPRYFTLCKIARAPILDGFSLVSFSVGPIRSGIPDLVRIRIKVP